ncbi:hypothetical protein T4D_13070 [Trichinella pseudospiralis]|uniref:Uncharacterized protein n=1 Tax=Trichinella pseudospiralis TaxID=6337 RepID=A0A0V1FU45_TRIPS|nr:hypothetical protein T4D_13070 [Trichinella pseudospiralis]
MQKILPASRSVALCRSYSNVCHIELDTFSCRTMNGNTRFETGSIFQQLLHLIILPFNNFKQISALLLPPQANYVDHLFHSLSLLVEIVQSMIAAPLCRSG